jgi:rSAM/selenodomain-associated transferase 2
MPPLVSMIVPILADVRAVQRLLRQISPDPRLEVIIADGGGNPGIDTIARAREDVQVIRSSPGRALQMNAGAAIASGEWLLFLHADSTLPGAWLDIFERSITHARGGWFEFALDDHSWQARLIEHGVRWRVRVLRLPYGDQGLFVTRTLFNELGGYRHMPLMEDVEFVRRLIRAAPVVQLPVPLRTSARRWRREGWARRTAGNLVLITLYLAGVSPDRLARWYVRGS